MRRKSLPADEAAATDRLRCPGQSYLITLPMCEARREKGFGRCPKCSLAKRLAKSA